MSPPAWRTVRLRYVARAGPPVATGRLLADDEVTFLPLECVWPGDEADTSRRRRFEQVAKGYTRFAEGDVLVPKITPTFEAKRSTVARGLLDGGPGFGTTELHVLRPDPGVDPDFLMFRTLADDFVELGTAAMMGVAGQQRVPGHFLKDFEFELPPLGEQREIARFLHVETNRIRGVAAVKRRMLDLLGERREAALARTFARMPRDARLGYVGRWLSGGTPPRDRHELWKGDVPWASSKDLRGDYVEKTMESIAEEAARDHSRVVPAGSVLLATRGMALAKRLPMALTRRAVAFNQDLKAIVPARGVEGEYLRIVLRAFETRVLGLAIEAAHGTKRIETQALRAFHVPLPSQDVQRRIVGEALAAEGALRDLQLNLERQLALIEERRQALVTAAVTGRLSPSSYRAQRAVA